MSCQIIEFNIVDRFYFRYFYTILGILTKQRDKVEIFQTSTEARCLADQVELYYNKPSPSKLGLLEKFTRQPTLFSHEDLIAEMNSITLGETAAKN